MALQDILSQIAKQAERDIAELNNECEKTLQKITAEYNEKRSARQQEMKKKVQENSTKIRERADAFANMEVRSFLLQAKRELLEKIFNKSLDALLSSAHYETMMVNLLKEAATAFKSGTLIPAKGHEEATRHAVAAAHVPFTLANVSADIRGGFLLETERVEGNFSFEAILKKELWDELEVKLHQLLFT